MQTSYEVNRLAKNYLSSVYEKLVPIIKQQIKSNEEKNQILFEGDIQTLKRNTQ
ncbi:MAG TPA: hypothetical protein VJN02_07620 [Gammaproteobacteria bacterium]|nr:hypothetical protein [Gammaproteobacteria bacterium]